MNGNRPNPTERSPLRFIPVGAVALLWLLLAYHSVWYKFNNRIPPTDDVAFHLHTSFTYYELLKHRPENFLKLFYMADTFYPPFAHLCAAVMLLITGMDPAFGKFIIPFFFLPIFLFSTYAASRRVLPRWPAFIITFSAGTTPGAFTSLHGFMLSMPLMAMISLSAYFLIKSNGLTIRRYAIAAGIVFGIGMLVKFTFPFYAGGFFLAACYKGWCSLGNRLKVVIHNGLIVMSIAAGIASLWYAPNFIPFIKEAYFAGFVEQSLNVGFVALGKNFPEILWDPVSYTTALAYFMGDTLGNWKFPVWLLLFWFFLFRDSRNRVRILLWLLVPYFCFLLIFRKQPKDILPFLPAATLTLAFAVAALTQVSTKCVVLGTLGAIGLFSFYENAVFPLYAGPVAYSEAGQQCSINWGYYSHPIVVEDVRDDIIEQINENSAFRPIKDGGDSRQSEHTYWLLMANLVSPYARDFWGPRLGYGEDFLNSLRARKSVVFLGVDTTFLEYTTLIPEAYVSANSAGLMYHSARAGRRIVVMNYSRDEYGRNRTVCRWPADYYLVATPLNRAKLAHCPKDKTPALIWQHSFSDKGALFLYRIPN